MRVRALSSICEITHRRKQPACLLILASIGERFARFGAQAQHIVHGLGATDAAVVDSGAANGDAVFGRIRVDLDVALRVEVQGQLADEEGEQTEDDEQPQRRDVAHAMTGQIAGGDAAGYAQIAQGAENAAVEMPERLQHFFDCMTEMTQWAVRTLAAHVAIVAAEYGRAVFAGGRHGVMMVLAHVLPRARQQTSLRYQPVCRRPAPVSPSY